MGSASASTRCIEAAGGTLVDLCEMNRVLRVDRDSVTVQPGITLAELADVLDAEGLELIGGFDYANRTVGGAVFAAGLEAVSADEGSSFGANVNQIKFVSANGQKGTVNQETATMLRLFRQSYGLLGIAYEVTLRVRPMRNFDIRSIKVEAADLSNVLAGIANAGTAARIKLFPFRGTVHCELRQSTERADKGAKLAWRLKSWAVNSAMPAAAFALAKVLPVDRFRYPLVDALGETTLNLSSLGPLKSGTASTEELTQTNIFGAANLERSSWAYPQTRFAAVASEYFGFCKEHFERTGFRCDQPATAYPAPRDSSSLLSPAFDQPIVTLCAMSAPAEGWQDFSFELAEFAARNGGIPLFGQSQHLSAATVCNAFGRRWDAFRKTRQQLDPERRLVNSFFENFLTDRAT